MEIIARLANLPGALPGACAQGLIWGIMAIGVYLTYRILDVADLTVDGSLALGGALGIIAVLLRQEFLLVIMGGVFVVETLSVILQVGSFKLRGQRIFRMAPIHHHYELKGWPEPRVIVRFWIISLMLVLIGLATLKVR